MKKRSVVLFFLLVIFAIITTTYAFTVTPISVTVGFVESPRTNSDREISSYEAHPLGEDSVFVKFTVAAGSAYTYIDVRVIPLDGSSNVLTAVTGTATIQRKIDSGAWNPTAHTIANGDDIISEYTGVSNTSAFIVYITFDEEDIAANFVSCMIEIREYN